MVVPAADETSEHGNFAPAVAAAASSAFDDAEPQATLFPVVDRQVAVSGEAGVLGRSP